MKDIDVSFDDKIISEDEKFTQKEEVEDAVKEYVEKAESMGDKKNEELMTV